LLPGDEVRRDGFPAQSVPSALDRRAFGCVEYTNQGAGVEVVRLTLAARDLLVLDLECMNMNLVYPLDLHDAPPFLAPTRARAAQSRSRNRRADRVVTHDIYIFQRSRQIFAGCSGVALSGTIRFKAGSSLAASDRTDG